MKKKLFKFRRRNWTFFQFADDFLDIKGNKKLVGKPIKKEKKRKINFGKINGL